MAGCVGDDVLGRAMLEALAGRGRQRGAAVAEPTGISVGLARPGDRAMLTALGALASFTAEDVPDELLASARWVHVASPFLQPGARRRRDRRARGAGTTSLDPGWDPHERWELAWEGFDVLLPNAQEACGSRGGGRRGGGSAARGTRAAGRGEAGRGGRAGPCGDLAGRGAARGSGRRHRRGRLVRRGLHRRAARGGGPRGGARARLRVRRAEHAGGRRHGRAADARRGA